MTLSDLPAHILWPQDPQQAQRLFHGRGHAFSGLEHINIDWLPPVALITLFSACDKAEIITLARLLLDTLPGCTSVQQQNRYISSGPVDILLGENLCGFVTKEDGIRYRIQLGKSRNSGLFLDMRNGRRWVRQHSAGKRVLNLFAYTCGFSLAAIEGGANTVLNADISGTALSRGRENHRLNDHALENVRFEKVNIFKSFGRLKKRGPFDLLICDPPSFQKGSIDVEQDYPKIIRRLDEFMMPESQLLLCLNTPRLGREFLLEHVETLAPGYQFTAAVEPPEAFQDAQGRGLKVLGFQRSC